MRILRSAVLAVALLVSFLGGSWAGASLARALAVDSGPLVGAVLEPTALHRLGMRALELDIANSDYIAGINRGPLQITEEEISRVMSTTFDEGDTSAKAAEVQQALLDFVRRYPEDSIFSISIAEERPILADSLSRILLDKYRTLPECGFGDDVGTLLDAVEVRLFGGSGSEFYYEEHPDCRPPDVVASRVEEGIRQEFAEQAETGPDALEAFPEEPDDPRFARAMDTTARVLSATGWWWPALLLSVGALAHVGLGRIGSLWRVGFGFGLGLVCYGITALTVAPSRIESALAGTGTVGQASEVWASLGIYGFKRVAAVSGWWSVGVGAVLVVVSIGVAYALGRRRTSPESSRIGSARVSG